MSAKNANHQQKDSNPEKGTPSLDETVWEANEAPRDSVASPGGLSSSSVSPRGNDPAENPAEDPAENPAEDPAEGPTENPAEAPAEEPEESPVESPVESQSAPQLPNPQPEAVSPWRMVWVNLAVLLMAICLAVLFFFLGPDLFRVKPSDHFLTGIPVSNLEALYPLPAKALSSAPSSDVLIDKTVLIVLWGPWDPASCEMLDSLSVTMTAAMKNPQFQILPIAYLEAWSGMRRQEFGMAEPTSTHSLQENPDTVLSQDGTETPQDEEQERAVQLAQMMRRQSRMLAQVQQVCSQSNLPFTQNWWDPTDDFRTGLTAMALTVFPDRKYTAAGIGLPTFLWVENGVVKSVWAGSSRQNLEELKEQLKLVAAGQQ